MKKIIITLLLTITCIGSLLVFTPKSNAYLNGGSWNTGWQQGNYEGAYFSNVGLGFNNCLWNNYGFPIDEYLMTNNTLASFTNGDDTYYYYGLSKNVFEDFPHYGNTNFTHLLLSGFMDDQSYNYGDYDHLIRDRLKVFVYFAFGEDNFNYIYASANSTYLYNFTDNFYWFDPSINGYYYSNCFDLALKIKVPTSYVKIYYGIIWNEAEYSADVQNVSTYFNDFSLDNDFIYGYNTGQVDGYNNGYTIGYNDGNSNGLTTGYNNGYNQGLIEGRSEDSSWFANGLMSIFTIPFGVFSSIWNFDIMGINISSIILALLSLGLVAWIIKKIFLSR